MIGLPSKTDSARMRRPLHQRFSTSAGPSPKVRRCVHQPSSGAPEASRVPSSETSASTASRVRIFCADLTIRCAMRFAVTIAGADPTGGAGLQADVQVFRAHGVRGGAVPTALTVQDGRKVQQVLPLFPSVVLAQLRALFEASPPDAVKLGMLASDDVARSVALALAGLSGPGGRPPPLVVDPVLAAS